MREIIDLIRTQYDHANTELSAFLDNVDNQLSGKLRALKNHQLLAGFIKDDLKAVARLRLVDGEGSRHFLVQYNPRRAQRQHGTGRTVPPPGVSSINSGCFLCPENIWWQQYGIEIGCDVILNGRAYKAWTNPFPLKEAHFTVASEDHVPQSWVGRSGAGLKEMLEDLVELAQQLPSYLVFYNGEGAGASIPHHRHYQCFGRDDAEPFPLEKAADEPGRGAKGSVVRDYPITALHFRGKHLDRSDVVNKLVNWTSEWTKVSGQAAVSANIIATVDAPTGAGSDVFDLYFIPRNRLYSRGPGMVGTVGGLEVLGELVFSTELENERLNAGLVDYKYVHRVLAAVEAPGVADFLRTIR